MKKPEPYGPIPSPRQLEWHAMEFYGFIHFGVNTFTDKEWGYGDEDPGIFNPSEFDPDQIAGTAAEGGMAGLILTCKHHDGFCLWPSRHTEHSVKNSPWKNGKGDMVKETADACRRAGLKFGVYLSPWDRNHAEYGRSGYLDYYRNQLEELTTEYGELFEVWFDGANGGDGYYGGAREHRKIPGPVYYEWDRIHRIVRENQPGACMFSDTGPDIRWVGNEDGIAGDPCWPALRESTVRKAPDPSKTGDFTGGDLAQAWAVDRQILNRGERDGGLWRPAECDVSIRPGWFYHAEEDKDVRDPGNLLDLYFKSVGRGGSLLLNLPPDKRGKIHPRDAENLKEFRTVRDRLFADDLAGTGKFHADNVRGGSDGFGPANLADRNPGTYWAADDHIRRAEIILTLPGPARFSVISLREHLPLGRRINEFRIEIDRGRGWETYGSGESIGARRLIRGEPRRGERIKLVITGADAAPVLQEFGVY